MLMSLRKMSVCVDGVPESDMFWPLVLVASELWALLQYHTLLAHHSKAWSCVTPRCRVTGAMRVRPGDTRVVMGSAPSRCSMGSVERERPLTELTPATGCPSQLTTNLKFLYGSMRAVSFVNCAIYASVRWGFVQPAAGW